MIKLGIVTGLKSETQVLRLHSQAATAVATGSGLAARAAAERLIENGATALLSFGIAGGLDPALVAGTLVVADAVRTESRDFLTDDRWRNRLAARLGAAVAIGAIAGVERPVATAAEKAALRAAGRPIAVDTESRHVADAAASRGLPFLVVRAVADPAWRTVPRAALEALSPDGSVRVGVLIGGLLRRPAETLALPRLARDYRAAMRALRRAAAETGATFAVV